MAVYDLEEQERVDDLKAWWARWGNARVVDRDRHRGGHRRRAGLALLAGEPRRGGERALLHGGECRAQRRGCQGEGRDGLAGRPVRGHRLRAARRAALRQAALERRRQARARRRSSSGWSTARPTTISSRSRATGSPRCCSTRRTSTRRSRCSTRSTPRPTPGLYADLRGDALAAAGRTAEARAAYQLALAKIDAKTAYRNFVQVKLDALGGAPAADAAAPSFGAPGAAGVPPAPAAAPAAPPATAPAAPQEAVMLRATLRAATLVLALATAGCATISSWMPTIPVPSWSWFGGGARKPGPLPELTASVTPSIAWQALRRQGDAGLRSAGDDQRDLCVRLRRHRRAHRPGERPPGVAHQRRPHAVRRRRRGRHRGARRHRQGRRPRVLSGGRQGAVVGEGRQRSDRATEGRRGDRGRVLRRRPRLRARDARRLDDLGLPARQPAAHRAQQRGGGRSFAAACSSAPPAGASSASTSPPERWAGNRPSPPPRARPNSSASPTSPACR